MESKKQAVVDCLYFSTTLGLKFKFRNEGSEDDLEAKTSVIVLDNNAISDPSINKPTPKSISPRQGWFFSFSSLSPQNYLLY
jgi:hypothetical protein